MGRGEVAIRQAFLKDGVGDLAMQGQPFGLLVFFVPAQAQPAQPLENRIDRSVGVALNIGVIEAQDHRPAVVAGVEPVENKRSGTADVEKPGGRWGESNTKHNV